MYTSYLFINKGILFTVNKKWATYQYQQQQQQEQEQQQAVIIILFFSIPLFKFS